MVEKSTVSAQRYLSCGICRTEDILDNLLSPCNCKGMSRYVHFTCLKIWIEASCSDVCNICRFRYKKGITIQKNAGRFGRFFANTVIGRFYSHAAFAFFVLFYLTFFISFHSRLAAEHFMPTVAIILTTLNTFYAVLFTLGFLFYIICVIISFITWKQQHFDLIVLPATS